MKGQSNRGRPNRYWEKNSEDWIGVNVGVMYGMSRQQRPETGEREIGRGRGRERDRERESERDRKGEGEGEIEGEGEGEGEGEREGEGEGEILRGRGREIGCGRE